MSHDRGGNHAYKGDRHGCAPRSLRPGHSVDGRRRDGIRRRVGDRRRPGTRRPGRGVPADVQRHGSGVRDGTDKGEAQLENRFGPFGPIHIEIDCLKVVANTAFMSGTVTHVGDPTLGIFEGSKAFFAVQDNGEGPDSPPDRLSFALFTGETTGPSCEEILDLAFVFTVEDGNIQVRSS
jgi:hypothetical protein